MLNVDPIQPKDFEELLKQQAEMASTLKYFQEKSLRIEASLGEKRSTEPAYDLYIQGHALYLELELPGTREDSVEIKLTEGQVQIRGVFFSYDQEQINYLIQLRPRGPFEYLFQLPQGLKIQRHETRWFAGVLYLKADFE
jgi:HSP20 family molecular chaperone IbpA